jgi:hypothetical protein
MEVLSQEVASVLEVRSLMVLMVDWILSLCLLLQQLVLKSLYQTLGPMDGTPLARPPAVLAVAALVVVPVVVVVVSMVLYYWSLALVQ